MSRAAYMREYRARKKHNTLTPPNGTTGDLIGYLENEVDRLTEEVARLKRELAARPIGDPGQDARVRKALSHPTRPFTEFRPVPKPGKH